MATPHKAPTIRPPASHHENYPSYTNQTCRALLEKQGRAHKWCTPIDPQIWPSKSKTTSSNIHAAAMWGYGMPEAMNDKEKWRERVKDIRASGTTWWWWYIYIYIYIYTKEDLKIEPLILHQENHNIYREQCSKEHVFRYKTVFFGIVTLIGYAYTQVMRSSLERK